MPRIKRRFRLSKPKMKRRITTCSSCSKRANSLQPKEVREKLTSLLTNPGLDHIPRQVLGYLDAQTVVSCLRVSKALKGFVENERHWYLLQSKILREKKPPKIVIEQIGWGSTSYKDLSDHFNYRMVPGRYPQWLKVFEYFENEASFDDLKGFVWLIKDYTTIDVEDDECFKYSPLFHAAKFGSLNVIQFCLDNGFCFDLDDLQTKRPPRYEMDGMDYRMMGEIMERERKEQVPDDHKSRMTPLSMACKHAQTEAVRLILSYSETKEIGLGSYDDTRKTAFHWACLSGNLDIVKLLLSHMDDPSKSELTPIQIERRKKKKEYRDSVPEAEWQYINADRYDERLDKIFADSFVEPNKADQARMTGFLYACREGQTEIVGYLMEKADDLGLDLQAVDLFKSTGLHLASKHGKIEVLKLFLNSTAKNVDLNARNLYGATPFMVACEENQIEIVEELIQHSEHSNIVLNARDKLGRTAFFRACEQGHYEIVTLLYQHRIRSSYPFHSCCVPNVPLPQEEPQEDKVDIFATDDQGINAYQIAYEKKHEHIVKLLQYEQEYKHCFRHF